MKMTLEISGMMCPRCEKHVQKGLLALDGVQPKKSSWSLIRAAQPCGSGFE